MLSPPTAWQGMTPAAWQGMEVRPLCAVPLAPLHPYPPLSVLTNRILLLLPLLRCSWTLRRWRELRCCAASAPYAPPPHPGVYPHGGQLMPLLMAVGPLLPLPLQPT